MAVVQPPNSDAPMVDDRGVVFTAWYLFFAAFAETPHPMEELDLTGSPFSYTANEGGSIFISGGNVSAVTLTRGRTTLNTGLTSGFFPIGWQDIIEITYTVAPTVYFIPGGPA